MKNKGLSLFIGLQIAIFSTLTHADIVFQGVGPDICAKLPGAWAGQGTVKALSGMVNCTYSGVAQVEIIDGTTASNHFNMKIDLTKQKGALCPASESLTLQGACDNGAISLKTTEADLTGTLDSTGTQINNVVGTITFTVPTGKVTANVSNMNLRKS